MFIELYFNPQGPYGPRRLLTLYIPDSMKISIHKALTGLDWRRKMGYNRNRHFNPQGPYGPRPRPLSASVIQLHFNPQGPYGPRRRRVARMPTLYLFQSTRPLRASTRPVEGVAGIWRISIHKALTGLDQPKAFKTPKSRHFNPQGPYGPRLQRIKRRQRQRRFQSTRPLRASTFRQGA